MAAKPIDSHNVTIARMSRNEVDTAVDWARQEGWNPGLSDAECFYRADPGGFYAAKVNGELVGMVSMVRYSKDYAFGGFYIVRPDMRRMGIGAVLMDFFQSLSRGFNVGIDGVLEMQQTYARHGFLFAHKNIRYGGIAKGVLPDRCTAICEEDFNGVVAFDARQFSTPRPEFLRRWLFQKDARALMIKADCGGGPCGYGVIRRCFRGHKVGPLFANSPDVAEDILQGLMSSVPGEEVYLDVPEPNGSAVELAQRHGMRPVFATARMYTKRVLDLPLDCIYGVTSFELG